MTQDQLSDLANKTARVFAQVVARGDAKAFSVKQDERGVYGEIELTFPLSR